ncbi:TIGR01777 family oxidoreductase [Rhabdobacter roseus]|nr:TIGR01777 family oxidoreductase [Rhabdobacter roseus]
MAKKVLITGGTGVIGRRLTELLLEKGYDVAYLSRSQKTYPNVRVYRWEVEKGYLEEGALENLDYLIHLAGAGVADQRWTDERKKEIIRSRTDTIALVAHKMAETRQFPQAFVSSSAIGYYGADTGDLRQTEQSPPGRDFLADVTVQWEAAADRVQALGIRTVKIRTGVVLSAKGGALPRIAAPARWGLGAPLGSGKQWMSWIHVDDLCRMYLEALEKESWEGTYNGVAPQPATNAELTRTICKVLGKPQWAPKVPAFALKAAFGEMAQAVLGSSFVQSTRLGSQPYFAYQYPALQPALENLLLES